MREILFRGKIGRCEWIYGCFVKKRGIVNIFKNGILYEVAPETVGQFTGLTDKNGVKIFEGDILKIGENLKGDVIFIDENSQDYGDEIHAAFHCKIHKHNKTIPIDSYLLNNCKVIGNIHDNPELLN